MDNSDAAQKLRSAWSKLELLGSVVLVLVAVLQLVLGNFLWAALMLLLAISAAGQSRARDLDDGVTPLIRWNPPQVLQIVFALAGWYLACWFASYFFVMGRDFRWLNRYFEFGWAGGLETPATIQFLALSATAVIAVIWGFISLWRLNARRKAPGAR